MPKHHRITTTVRRPYAKQTGNSNKDYDAFYTALAPGWRMKRMGGRTIKWYYEARKNRSDVSRIKRL